MISRIPNKVVSSLVAIASLIVIVYFGTLLYKQFQPQTLEEKMMRCLELGSDTRASACITLLPDKPKSSCQFEIAGVKEYSGQYGEGGVYYKIYEGTIKNTSDRKEHLKAMIGKLYTKDKVLVETGYTSIEEDVDGGVSLPFEVKIQSFSKNQIDTLSGGSSGFWEGLSKDVYPWFTTCE